MKKDETVQNCLTCKWEPAWSEWIDCAGYKRCGGSCRYKVDMPALPITWRIRTDYIERFKDDSGLPGGCEAWEPKAKINKGGFIMAAFGGYKESKCDCMLMRCKLCNPDKIGKPLISREEVKLLLSLVPDCYEGDAEVKRRVDSIRKRYT